MGERKKSEKLPGKDIRRRMRVSQVKKETRGRGNGVSKGLGK